MRIFAGIFILFLSLIVSPLILLPLALWYAMTWFAVELIVLGALIDAYFGVGYLIPYYTLGAFLVVVVSECAKPYLSFYTD